MAERYGVSRSTLRAALDELESAGAVRRVPGARAGRSWPSARSSATSRASRACPRTCGGKASRAARACSRPRPRRPMPRRQRPRHPGRRGRLRDRPHPARRRRADLVRACTLPGGPLSGLLDHPLGGSLYSCSSRSTGSCRASQRSASRSSVPARPPRACSACADPRPSSRSRASPSMPTGRPFELSHDLFRADRVRIVVRARADAARPGSWRARSGSSKPLAGPPERSAWRHRRIRRKVRTHHSLGHWTFDPHLRVPPAEHHNSQTDDFGRGRIRSRPRRCSGLNLEHHLTLGPAPSRSTTGLDQRHDLDQILDFEAPGSSSACVTQTRLPSRRDFAETAIRHFDLTGAD